ncbi:MAG: prepilin peptidase [Muribaculaceae bacterium]|nr:prepilin peptidase [Muribaculaceae bacterium]MCM1491735.1 prepilin peptidase [Muribaculaceae bacterium]
MEEMLQMGKTIAGLAGLGYLSVEDIRRRELATPSILVVGAAGLALSLLGGEWRELSVLIRFVPGLLCLLLACVSRESIGYGDGLVILCMGAYLPLAQLLQMCMTALTLAGLAALFLLLVRHRGRKTTLPLIPFLLAGYVLVQAGGNV